MSELQTAAKLKIQDGRLEDFKRLGEQIAFRSSFDAVSQLYQQR